MKFSEIKLDPALVRRHRYNLILRTVLSVVVLAASITFAMLTEFPDLRYPKSPGAVLVIGACLACWYVFRVQTILFDRSWVGTVEEVGLKTMIRPGSRGRPTEKQAFFMTIRREDDSLYDYLNFETVGKRPSEVEASSGMVRRVETPHVSVMGMGGAESEESTDSMMEGELNRFGTSAPYAVGDTVVHLRGQKYFATYGKHKDSFAVCPLCGEIVIPERTKCYRCGAPVLK